MESINKGHVYKFLLKPWNDQNLKLEITQALEHYDLIQANKRLHETVLERNEALKGINENLEALVKDRTRELEIKNHALELSQAILEDLPLPIIGVSSEGTIVLINREVQSLSNRKDSIVIGKGLLDCFSGGVKEMLDSALETNSSQGIRQCRFSEATYDIDCIPLLGRFKGKGAILTLKPAK
jgi:PAS domain-containing protein